MRQRFEMFTQTEERGMTVHHVISIGLLISEVITLEDTSAPVAQILRSLNKTG